MSPRPASEFAPLARALAALLAGWWRRQAGELERLPTGRRSVPGRDAR